MHGNMRFVKVVWIIVLNVQKLMNVKNAMLNSHGTKLIKNVLLILNVKLVKSQFQME